MWCGVCCGSKLGASLANASVAQLPLPSSMRFVRMSDIRHGKGRPPFFSYEFEPGGALAWEEISNGRHNWERQLHPSITITTVIDSSQAVFLDMVIFKGARWSGSGHTLLDCRVHTKPGSLHLYIPSFSCHPRGATTGFISGEARRFVCLSTSHEGALEQCLVFARALYARGYPIDTIVNELGKVDYNKRFQYLRLTPTPTSSVVNPVDASDARVVAFVVPYTPITARWGIGKALKECFESTPHLTPVLAWSNSPNLQRTLSLRNLKPAPPALLNPPPC